MNLRSFLPALALAAAVAAPLAALGATTTVPAGVQFHALMNQSIDSGAAQVGQHLTMQVVAPYPNGDANTWAGSTISGHIIHVQHASQGRKAELGFVFDKIALRHGASAAISANLVSIDKKQGSNLGHAALTTVGGMVVGNILGKWLGTNAGGAVGAVGGALYGINQKTNFTIPSGAKVHMALTQPLTVVRP